MPRLIHTGQPLVDETVEVPSLPRSGDNVMATSCSREAGGSINILVAAHELVVPIEPHPLSLMVLRRLFDTVRRIKRLNPGLTVHGFLPTKVHHSSRLAADMLATLEEEFPDLALLPAVPLSVRGAESVAERTSVLHYMPRSAVATAYRDVAAWIDTHDPAARPAQLAGARRA